MPDDMGMHLTLDMDLGPRQTRWFLHQRAETGAEPTELAIEMFSWACFVVCFAPEEWSALCSLAKSRYEQVGD